MVAASRQLPAWVTVKVKVGAVPPIVHPSAVCVPVELVTAYVTAPGPLPPDVVRVRVFPYTELTEVMFSAAWLIGVKVMVVGTDETGAYTEFPAMVYWTIHVPAEVDVRVKLGDVPVMEHPVAVPAVTVYVIVPFVLPPTAVKARLEP